MVMYKNSALKDILKARGVRGYSTKGKDDLLKMVMESGGLNIPLEPLTPKTIEAPKVEDIKPPKKAKAVKDPKPVEATKPVEETKAVEATKPVAVKKKAVKK